MVRLEVWFEPLPLCSLSDFNSCMVRLEVCLRLKVLWIKPDFNSCMVRLEADTITEEWEFLRFQFLYGTIGSSVRDLLLP